MEEIPNFEMIASGAGTCVTLFAGLFYIYEYFSFFVLVRSLANSNMPGILDSVGFKREGYRSRVSPHKHKSNFACAVSVISDPTRRFSLYTRWVVRILGIFSYDPTTLLLL